METIINLHIINLSFIMSMGLIILICWVPIFIYEKFNDASINSEYHRFFTKVEYKNRMDEKYQ
jgi:hypothetical protein